MTNESQLVLDALQALPSKPPDNASRSAKQSYSQRMSSAIANALAEAVRARGLTETRPAPPGTFDRSGAERRIAGGIGDKKVDVSWATEQAGLMLGFSIKTINFRDQRTKNYQKNFTNRRGDLLFEAVTLHRRFPYAVLAGLMFLDSGAATDGTSKRRHTFLNAHAGLRLFTGRNDPAGREEQLERFYLALVDATPFRSSVKYSLAGDPNSDIPLSAMLDDLVSLVAERNADSYEFERGMLTRR